MLRLFISGLREDIKNSVLVHRPTTYEETLDLSHLHEKRNQAEKGITQPTFSKTPPLLPTPNSITLTLKPLNPLVSKASSSNPPTHLPLKRLSHAEMQSHHERGCATIAKRSTLLATNVRPYPSFSYSLTSPKVIRIYKTLLFLLNFWL